MFSSGVQTSAECHVDRVCVVVYKYNTNKRNIIPIDRKQYFPSRMIKGIFNPGAVVNGIAMNMTIPSRDNILNIYYLTDVKKSNPALSDIQLLEVLTGSYFSLAGAFVGILKTKRMSMFGTLLISWGLVKEGIIEKPSAWILQERSMSILHH